MIRKLSGVIAAWLTCEGTVSVNERNLYGYAAYSLFWGLLPVLIAASAGFLLGVIKESLLMMLPFMLIRKFSGGYHLKSEKICLCTSTLLIILTCTILRWILYHVQNYTILSIVTALSCVSLCALSPIDSSERKLNPKEKQVFRRIAQVISCLTLMVYFSLILLRLTGGAVSICMGLILAAVLQLPCLFQKPLPSTCN